MKTILKAILFYIFIAITGVICLALLLYENDDTIVVTVLTKPASVVAFIVYSNLIIKAKELHNALRNPNSDACFFHRYRRSVKVTEN